MKKALLKTLVTAAVLLTACSSVDEQAVSKDKNNDAADKQEVQEKETKESSAQKKEIAPYLTMDKDEAFLNQEYAAPAEDVSELVGLYRGIHTTEEEGYTYPRDWIIDIKEDGTYTSIYFDGFYAETDEYAEELSYYTAKPPGYYVDKNLEVQKIEREIIGESGLTVSSGYVYEYGTEETKYGLLQVDIHNFAIALNDEGIYTMNSPYALVNEETKADMSKPEQQYRELGLTDDGDLYYDWEFIIDTDYAERIEKEDLFELMNFKEVYSTNQLIEQVMAHIDEREKLKSAYDVEKYQFYYHTVQEAMSIDFGSNEIDGIPDPDINFLEPELFTGFTRENREITPDYVWSVDGTEINGYDDHFLYMFDENSGTWH